MKKFYLCSLLALGVIACTHDFVEPQTLQEAEELTLLTRSDDGPTTPSNGDGIVLGQKLNNPYSVENMNNTIQGLYGPVDFFDPTHYYVRFLPQDSLDYNILLSDTTLILFDYPLDYEIAQYGDYYHDPSIPEDEITWQYTVVPVNYQFPQIRYEILEECFIPYDDFDPSDYGAEMNYNVSPNTNSNNVQIDFSEVERQAFINSGNGHLLKSHNYRARSGKARSFGYVFIIKNSENECTLEPLEGIKVITRLIVKIAEGTTDETGYFVVNRAYDNSFCLNHILQFENRRAKVVRLLAETKKSLGISEIGYKEIGIFADSTQMDNNPSVDIPIVSNRLWVAGTILNAVSKYYNYCKSFYIPVIQDKQLRILLTTVLNAFNSDDRDLGSGAPMLSYNVISRLNNLNLLKQYLRDNDHIVASWGVQFNSAFSGMFPDIYTPLKEELTTRDITETIFHELAHTSHFSELGEVFWAKYIDEIIYNWVQDEYSTYGTPSNSPCCGVGEMWAGYFEKILMSIHFGDTYENILYGRYADWNIDWIRPQFLYNIASMYNLSYDDVFAFFCTYEYQDDIDTKEKLRDNIIEWVAYGPETDIAQEIRFIFDQYYGTYTSKYVFRNNSPMTRRLKHMYVNTVTELEDEVEPYSSFDIKDNQISYLINSALIKEEFKYMAVYDTNVMNMALVSYFPDNIWGNNHFFDDNSWTLNFDALNKKYIFTYETDY